METYLLKFSACLLVFWLVYILFLERQNMHLFKRFYLLAAFFIALIIPTLTITNYIEPVITDFETAPLFIPTEFMELTPVDTPSFFTLKNILWFIYGLGVLLFASRFIVNLLNMRRRISKNKQFYKASFIYVLLNENLIPHSFFRYIFFNKARYESNNIPKEVLLHEETHAKQLHSIDIILLELLQIVFWFHPLVYIFKHHVKLNHEFLADQAVLKQGSNARTYQNILLQFSSNTQNHQLSSAINYSSIKKRFTVMKTQTSKTRIWLSTILILPLIAILFFSFAEHVEIENPQVSNSSLPTQPINSISQETPIMVILINRKGELLIDDEAGTIKTLETKLKVLAQSNNKSNGILIRFDPTEASEKALKEVKKLTIKSGFNIIQEDASPELPIMTVLINRNGQLLVDDEVNTLKTLETKLKELTKSYDNSNTVLVRFDLTNDSKKSLNDVKSLIGEYNFKVIHIDASIDVPIPPAPPAPPKPIKSSDKGGPNANDQNYDNVKTGFLQVNGQTLYYLEKKEGTIYYNRWGQKVNPKGDIINSAQTHAEDVIKGHVISKIYKDNKVIAEFNTDNISIPPPPPATESTIDFVIRMAKNNAKFFNEGKAISTDKAIDLIKKNPKLNINAKKTETKQPLIYITKEPITINGKVSEHISKEKVIKVSPVLITIAD